MSDYADSDAPDPSTHTTCEHPESCIQCNWRQFICNLIPLCRFHHRVKHLTGWHIEIHPDRSITWTTPTGHRYRAPPPRLWE